jgi:hypothetical protein
MFGLDIPQDPFLSPQLWQHALADSLAHRLFEAGIYDSQALYKQSGLNMLDLTSGDIRSLLSKTDLVKKILQTVSCFSTV